MMEDDGRETVVRSRRGKIGAQAGTIAGIGIIAGLQSTRLLASSSLGKLGAGTGLSVLALAASGIAIAVAISIVRDDWSRSITLKATELVVRDNLGSYRLPYTNIERVKAVPMGGVVLTIRDPQAWLASATGDPDIRRRTAAVIRAQFGGDVWFYDKHMDVGGIRFVEILESRIGAASGTIETQQPRC